jgi:hypothetical protein
MPLKAALITGIAKELLDIYAGRFEREGLGFLKDLLENTQSKKDYLGEIEKSLKKLDEMSLLKVTDTSDDVKEIVKDVLKSIRDFQNKIGPGTLIGEDGIIGPATLRFLAHGLFHNDPDGPPSDAPRVQNSQLGRNQLGVFYDPRHDLPEVDGGDAHILLMEAFQKWSLACGVKFINVPSAEQAHIRVLTTDIAETGGANRLAVGTLGPPNGFQLELKFDSKENFVATPAQAGDGIVFPAVALHEIGHNIGLSHATIQWPHSAVMHPTYGPTKIALTDVDRKAALVLWPEAPSVFF